MYLLADAQCLQSPDSAGRGIGRYARNLLNALAAARPDWRVEAVENASLPPLARASLHGSIGIASFAPLLEMRSAARTANDRFFGEWLCARRPDVVLELNCFEEHTVVPTFPVVRPPLCAVVYDLIPVLFHERYLADADKVAWYADRLRQFAAADRALAISETTRTDVLRLMRWPAEKVVTIGGAPDPVPAVPADGGDDVLRQFGIDRPFILCVAGVDARKNVSGTLAGFAALPRALREAHQLVVTCALSSAQEATWQAQARDAGIAAQVRFTDYISDQALHTLYERCRASVFLSFYEGLGLPVLEALRSGAPVVASNRSSIPEFVDRTTALIDPASSSAFVAALEQILAVPRDAGAAERRQFAAQFTWDRTAVAAVAALESMPPLTRLRQRRCRVAWVSPLPPTRSGIADYSRELLQQLSAELLDIELVVSAQAVMDTALASRFRVVNEHDVHERHRTAPFDLFVYHVGNSDLHVYMLGLMRRYAGLVVLHELFLGGLALRAAEVGAWPNLAADLEREGAADLAAAARRGEADHDRIASEVALNSRLVAGSEAVVAHNAWSWRRLRREPSPPVFHIPMGVGGAVVRPVQVARASLGIPDDAFVVATLGEVNASKRLDRVIAAFAELPSTVRRRLQFFVVGHASPTMRESLRAAAAARGVAECLRFVGHVPLEHLALYARAADACVQLRYPVRGETSAALLRALAGGGACIVSDADGYAEVAADSALRIRTPAHEVADLAAALQRLHDEPALGERLRANALALVAREHRVEDAARRYAAAIALTIAQRREADGEWRDAAASSLASATTEVEVDDAVIVRWAEVHAAAQPRRD